MKFMRAEITWFASLLLAVLVSVWGQEASAQSGPAFSCSGPSTEIYQVQSGQLRIFDPLTSSYENVGTNQGSYNATGYNIQDNYAYGSQGSNIIRIAADGSTEVVFNGVSGSYSGDVDYDNNYWLRTNNTTYRRIDLATGVVTIVSFTGLGGGPADIAYIEYGGGGYLIGFSSTTMYRYNISDGTKENISITGGLPSGGFGATWTDLNGRLFTFNNNTGEIWEIFDYDTGSPSAVFVAQADASGNNDGFSCPLASFPNLPPLAFDDDYTTPVNVDVVDNVITNNDNGIDNDPEGGAVTLNTTPVTDPANGTVVLNPDGSFTYTPDENFIGTDTFVYEIEDETGLTAQATVTITIEGTIAFSLAKSQTSVPNLATTAGQVLTYEVDVVNTGDIPLTDVAVEDTAPDGTVVTLTGPVEAGATPEVPGQLDIGETWTYSYDYIVTQDDIDAGVPLVNSVTGTTDETGATEETDSASTPVSQTIDYTLTKTVDDLDLSEPGLLTYEIVVTNTGNVTLTDAALTDTLAQSGGALTLTSGPTLSGDTDTDGDLDVGEVWAYAATFDATQAEIDDTGDIVNTANFTTTEAGDGTTTATTTIDAAPAMTVEKVADEAALSAPGTIAYTITISNDGNVSLTGVNVIDDLVQDASTLALTTALDLSGDLDGDLEIDVDEVWTYTATFDATQAEIDDGNDIVNTVTVETNELPDDSDFATTTITQDPSFTFAKTVDQAELSATGTLRYEVAVVNDGNVTMTGITFTDTITQGGATLTPIAPGPVLTGDTDGDGDLDVGESWLYVITLDVEQAQIDDGNPIINNASFDPDELPAQTDTAETTITQTDALGLSKAVATGQPTSFSTVGDTIDFTFVVENTGNTTRPGSILINDLDIDPLNPLVCQTGDLAPMATATCTFTWTAEQDDLDAGSFTNSATAEDDDGVTSDAQQATVTAVQSPAINIEKELTGTLPNFQSGETLNYTFFVTNTGNVTLPAPIDVTDPLVTNVSCGAVPTGGLPPLVTGDPLTTANSITCSGSYVISTADVDVGSIVNVATVSATFDGAAVEDQSEAIFPVDAAPALALDKATDPAVASFAALGDTITYTYTVTNQQPVGTPGVEITQPIIIDDDRLDAPLTCFAATGGDTLPVGASVTCEAEYTVTQQDLDAESVTNTATANSTYTNGDGDTATVISPPDSVTVTADITPALTVEKTVDAGAPDPAEEGASIPYTIVATNTGEQTLNNVAITDPQLGALTCAPTPAPVTLAPDEALTCTGSYLVTQDDIDDQTVGDAMTAVFTNTATATANDPFGVALDPVSDDADHPLDPALPELTILKELIPDPAADPAYENVGDVLRFRMTVTNTGNTTINAIEVTDSLVAGTCDIATLAPGDQDLTCLFDYVVEQSDIDAGEVLNTGIVTGQPANPGADPVENTDDFTSPGPLQTPSLEVVKAGTLDLGADGIATVGDTITYEITVTNTGNVTITDTVVEDEVVEPLTYAAADDADGNSTIDTLAPGDSAVVTATYTLDQDDIDLGTVTNTAAATGSDPNGDDVMDTSDSADPNDGAGDDDPTVTDIPRTPGMIIEKTASADLDVVEGTILTYTYDVTNMGNVTLEDITLVDEHVSASGVAFLDFSPGGNVVDTLLPGEMATLTATYTVTQDDIDAGADLTNTVTATSTGPAGTTGPTATDDEVVDLADRTPGIEIEKLVSEDTDVTVGTELTYTYNVENTGNVTLENVTLDDQHASATGTSALTIAPNAGVIATLAPDEIVTLTATYIVTQEDIDAGTDLTNVVTVTTESPDGTTPPTDSDNAVVDLADSAPGIEAIKTVQSQTGSAEGDQIVFEIVVANTGNVTLDAVTLTDTLRRADGTPITPVPAPVWDTVDDGDAGVLDVGEDWVYTVTYALTQDDIDAGGITNSVLVEADSPDDTSVTDVSDNGTGDGDDPTPVLIPAEPSLETVKVITSTTTELGGTVRFDITVANTGNVTLSDVAIASDELTRNDAAATPLTLTGLTFTGADDGSGEGTLQVGETATYSASYVLTQDDIDAGGITNTATATGTPPIGLPVTDVSDDDGAGADPTVLDIAPVPTILLDKRLADGFGPSFDADEEVLTFEFEITNTGNITLSPPYDIADPLITDQGGTITCPATDIAPDASIICTGDYETTQEDVDNGGFTNAATATVGDAAPVSGDVTVSAVQTPALALVKEAPSVEPVDFVTGLVVTYTFTSTNTGNTTLTDAITIDDALFDAADYNCPVFPADGLAPGDTYICTADYAITSDDVALAVVVNNATASSGDIDSEVASETIPNDGEPALQIEKTLFQANQPDGTDSGTLTFDEEGDQLVYQFEITNAGDIAFARDVEVFDTLFADPIACFVPSVDDPELASMESVTCEATYVVTQDDVDAGEVLNEAFARTEFGSIPTIVLSEPDDVTVEATQDPGVTILKEVDALTYAAVGDTLTYDIAVTNTGNQTLTNVVVDDPLFPTLACDIDTLPVGGELICSGSYTIEQSDIDNGSITNVATATGVAPDGNAIAPQDGTATSTGPVVTPTLDLEKIANPDPFGDLDSDLTFVFQVTNTSIYTISDITVTDVLTNGAGTFSCDVGTLLPGEISNACSVAVTVTQEDIDAGEIVNTATADGIAPGDIPVTIDDTVTVAGPDQEPGIALTKTAEVPATTLGSLVTFTFIAENTGNVSLSGVNIADDLSRNDGTPLDLTTPVTLQETGGFATGDVDTDGLLDPGEIWTYQSTYEITQDDINAGGFANTATVFSQPPGGGNVFDVSDDGNDGDGNTTDDPTEVVIDTVPVLDVEKVITQTALAVGETVIFEIRAANRGNVDLFNVVPSDALTRSDGTDLSGDITGPGRTANPLDNNDTTLDPGEVWTWDVSYTLTQDDIDAGGISNTALIATQDVDGNPVEDTSDNGDDGDGNTTDDPTTLTFPPTPGLDVTKVVTSVGTLAGENVVFTITAENTGNVTLSDVTLEDTMTNADGTPLAPLDIVVSGLVDGLLPPTETVTYTVTYEMTQADIDSGAITNTATVSSVSPTGGPVSDVSDNGDDADGNTTDDPTVATIVQTPEAIATKEADVPTRLSADIFEVTFTMTLENTGNVTLTNLVIEDDLTAFVAPATLVGVDTPVVSGFDVGIANAGYDGTGNIQLVADGAELAPDSIGTILLTVRYDAAAGSPAGENTISAVSDELVLAAEASTGVLASIDPDILATKTASPANAQLGDTITYTLRFENGLTTIESAVSFVDTLPDGMVYTPDTAVVTGGPDNEPIVAGNTLTWGPVDMDPAGVVEITYQVRMVGGSPGEYVNTAIAIGPDGQVLSNVASAIVTRRPEAVFECTDIIGKVFDDRNMNGYQDGLTEDRGVSDQSYEGGKFGVLSEVTPDGEPGIPNVRLSTPNGTLITTDEFGRYSVPCAALPADIGSNFFLKLDTRTLPTGYFVTTENPRVVRMTPGTMSRLNFGATLGTLVEIDLMAPAFAQGGAAPSQALAQYTDRLIDRIQSTPSVVRLTYYRAAESQRTANARLDALEDLIRDRWNGQGRYRLTIERIVRRTQ
ncbi:MULTISPECIES: DUF7507 domain-containing protein [Rhodobacterales]|uniref:DUF7507 domain-containing protein n=1 Tax=Rhodobacterales TaxID=204455 RepID=UPI0015F0E7C9|nr:MULTISPECIES: DUF11 domain-containing protein [Rhodobacterales]MDO6590181.1 DUF11 domain-containing protein [Yoonia sp. 1_MG-2023]